ncbi:MAG: TPM domain-containing protein [Salinivirgaceae bacterium]|nr:TPM domain-containing protein [Salinivirgaceae bacterium]
MKNLINIFLIFLSIFGSTQSGFANDDIFKKPAKASLVMDNANIFNQQEINALKNKLNKFSNETSTQILVYTTSDLQGYDVADFAQRLGEEWKVGDKGFDNGIVIIFKPKTSDSPGRVTIQTGYGIEPLIPDATANQIVENEMIPNFKQGQVYNGINQAVDICISLTKGEFTAAAYKPKSQSSGGGSFIVFVILAITFFSLFGRSRRSNQSGIGTRSNLPFWLALGLLGSGSSRGSGFSDFSGGSGSFGGGSSFGGFGGGSFGGGGASGSW